MLVGLPVGLKNRLHRSLFCGKNATVREQDSDICRVYVLELLACGVVIVYCLER